MPLYELKLAEFKFPKNLRGDNANFRFVVDLRFVDDKGRPAVEHTVMPSLDTYWECDPGQSEEPNFVRGKNGEKDIAAFDMNKIDDWDKLILFVTGESLHSIRFTVLDVDRKDFWDVVKRSLGKIAKVVMGRVKDVIPHGNALLFKSLGSAAEDAQSFLLKDLAGGDKVDRILFIGSKRFTEKYNKGVFQFTI